MNLSLLPALEDRMKGGLAGFRTLGGHFLGKKGGLQKGLDSEISSAMKQEHRYPFFQASTLHGHPG